jgi:hypothetical protein
MQAALDAGLDNLAADQVVTFQSYTKFVLWPDSSVFWIASNTTQLAKGSLHFATDRQQSEDETLGSNEFIFSSEQEVTAFNAISPTAMLIGSWPFGDGQNLKIVFSRRGRFYEEAKVWHYSGTAVLPAMQSQLVATAGDLPQGPIVSNSLPIWLAQNGMAPVYPSFLVPDNIVPPYIVAHIEPSGTAALGAFPIIGPWPGVVVPDSGASPLNLLASSQLMRDEVTLTLYGFTNQMALQYLQGLIQGSIDETIPFGFANSPAIVDEKRVQVEIASLAQKKTIEISANYLQGAADVIARRLILSAMVSNLYFIGGYGIFGQAAVIQGPQTVNAVGTVPG